MRDVTEKPLTRREAVAEALLHTSDDVDRLLAASAADKGDAPTIARVAGIMAAKSTWQTIPFCHPIPVTHAAVDIRPMPGGLRVLASCTTVAETGCEIEALNAAMTAALTLYDMLKPHTGDLQIDGVRLIEKRGGKSDWAVELVPPARVALLVTSSAVVNGKTKDSAGDAVRAALTKAGTVLASDTAVAQDEATVGAALDALLVQGFDLVITVGGTGLAAEDRTVEAVEARLDRMVPGIMEAARQHGQRRTPYAMLSRGVAGLVGHTLVVTFPGSTAGASETAAALLPHLLHVVRGQRGQA